MYNCNFLLGLRTKKIETLSGDLKGMMKPFAKLVLIYILKVSNFIGPRLYIS